MHMFCPYVLVSLPQVMVLYLPKGVTMPLHDHPAMTCFSKLLVGSTRVEAFDWVLPRVCSAGPAGSAIILTEKVRDEEITAPTGAWVLLPDSGGNRLVAGQDGPCAFINVHVPLYTAAADQLRCTIYKDLSHLSKHTNKAHTSIIPLILPFGHVSLLVLDTVR